MPVILPFHSEWITFGIILFLILGLVGFSEILRKRFNIAGEHSRQFVHVGVGLLVVVSPFIFRSALQPIVLALIFIILNAITLLMGQFKGMHTTERRSFGTVFFPLTFLILILVYWYSDPSILIVGMLIMTLADPLASIIGMRVKHPIKFQLWQDTKTVQGSLTVFVVSFLVAMAFFAIGRKVDQSAVPSLVSLVVIALAVGVVALLAEAISAAGSDNLSLPLFSAVMLDIMQNQTFYDQVAVLGWILLSFLLAFGAYKLRALTLGGATGAMLLGSLVFSIGGWSWVVPMATFFVLSSILSHVGKTKKNALKGIIEKGSQRDLYQVYANGGVSLLMALGYFYTEQPLFYWMFLGSLAAATADTWGTEIGVFARHQPIHILTGKPVPTGTSGGITVLGTSGLLAGAGILTLSGIFQVETAIWKLFVIIVVSGIMGALIDSVVGGTIQAQYVCPHCGKHTEKKIHCESYRTQLVNGLPWINNDVVNLICTTSGALLVWGLTALFL
jgi:uncharacterized protein (TIGR00297 family)